MNLLFKKVFFYFKAYDAFIKLFVYKKVLFATLVAGLFIHTQASALKIKFPDEELASESVLPIIKPTRMILNPHISLKQRVELAFGMGFGLDEPFYFPYYGVAYLAYHFTNIHSVNVLGLWFPPFLSNTGLQLKTGAANSKINIFDAQKAPYPQTIIFINYQYAPYYGKISLAKNQVLNLSIYGFSGLGILQFHKNNHTMAFNVGLGQKLYLNSWWSLRLDLSSYLYHGPAVARLKLDQSSPNILYHEIEQTDMRPNINFIIYLGMVFLI